ncbi:MAG TPA: Rpn family recombination-promoting nuclease/putative transposase [Thermoanaerobaculia bacterium]|jgi:predicted transposase YdaD|nr:Rpn family recombination-promoting nuclease/putative transposase [Thermoanaerobaculia bacterium]
MTTRSKKRQNGGAAGHDHGYKKLFSHARAVEELLRGFLEEDWAVGLDFSTLERAGTGFVSDDLRERRSDVIWRLRWKGGPFGWFYVYLLLEFQSTPDRYMALRLLVYVGLLLQELIQKRRLAPKGKLPAVLPIVVYNGKPAWRAPRDLASLFVPMPEGLLRRLPALTYQVLDEKRLDLGRPELSRNLTAALFRVETGSPEEVPGRIRELAALLPPDLGPNLRRDVMTWLAQMLRRSFPGATIPKEVDLEDTSMLEQTLADWWNKARKEGHQEGRREGQKEGQVEGMRRLLLQLLDQRFGPLPRRVRQRVEEISSLEVLSELARRVLQAGSLQEMGLG